MDDGPEGIEFARALIQRRAQGKGAEEIGRLLVEARDWERQASRSQEPAFRAAHEATVWERIADLVRVREWPAYDVALDEVAQAWTAAREARVQAERGRVQRVIRERQERELYVRLPGPVAQRLDELAGGLGVSAERLVGNPRGVRAGWRAAPGPRPGGHGGSD